MFGLIVRILAYLSIIGGFYIEFGNLPYRNLSGGLIFGGVALLLFLAFRRAWKTRGRMTPRDDD